ncbi:MAG: lamin tail domain-containing protein [Chloroflexi bacterium]|nr:lamin tail domain-containing protein [Chloroflexota bacterium]
MTLPTVQDSPGADETEDSDLRIMEIFYDGLEPRYEGDEFVEITNCGGLAQDLEDWVLLDISDGSPSFKFPTYVLHPGDTIRVYTDEIHAEHGGFSFGSGTAIWNNSQPDRAELRNPEGRAVSGRGYEPNTGCK